MVYVPSSSAQPPFKHKETHTHKTGNVQRRRKGGKDGEKSGLKEESDEKVLETTDPLMSRLLVWFSGQGKIVDRETTSSTPTCNATRYS